MPNGRGDSEERGVPRPFVFLALAVGLLALSLLALSLTSWQIRLAPQLLLVFLAATVAESAAISMPGGGAQSLSYPLSICALVLFGPATGGLVAALSVIQWQQLRTSRGRIIALFNAGQVLSAAVVSGITYHYLGGRVLFQWAADGALRVSEFTTSDFPRILPALLVLAVLSSLLNALLATLGVATLYGVHLRKVLEGGVLALAPNQLALAFLGYGLAQVVAVSTGGFVLFVFPLVVSRQVFQNYLALREAYLDSVTALVVAIETKDEYTSGHSRRVAQYSTLIAREAGLSDSSIERIERAALLHDLGKVAIDPEILNKPTFLSPSERLVINEHPGTGGVIAARVPYLLDIADIIASHHERYDGAGYSRGLAGEEIPIEARVLAVADAFDAMTSARAYRSALPVADAVREVEEAAGTQFDPRFVAAFLAVCSELLPDDGESSEDRSVV